MEKVNPEIVEVNESNLTIFVRKFDQQVWATSIPSWNSLHSSNEANGKTVRYPLNIFGSTEAETVLNEAIEKADFDFKNVYESIVRICNAAFQARSDEEKSDGIHFRETEFEEHLKYLVEEWMELDAHRRTNYVVVEEDTEETL